MFHGTITALLTPFKNGTIDEEAYRAHIEWQIEQGVNGVVPCGTTGTTDIRPTRAATATRAGTILTGGRDTAVAAGNPPGHGPHTDATQTHLP